MVRAVWIAAVGCALCLLGCAEDEIVPRTQLMLVADTDLTTLDGIEFEIRQGSTVERSGKISISAAAAPYTMAVLREDGSLGPVQVSATAYRGSLTLVTRSAELSFAPRETLVVPLHLVQSCVASPCGAGMTCTETGCEPIALGEDSLATWNGTPPRLGGTLATDGGAGGDAAANLALCSGRMVDLDSDLDHCGRCSKPCRAMPNAPANLVAACVDGACTTACRALWGDCDGDTKNGCENSLAADMENCGACGMSCATGEYCWVGSCRVSAGQN